MSDLVSLYKLFEIMVFAMLFVLFFLINKEVDLAFIKGKDYSGFTYLITLLFCGK